MEKELTDVVEILQAKHGEKFNVKVEGVPQGVSSGTYCTGPGHQPITRVGFHISGLYFEGNYASFGGVRKVSELKQAQEDKSEITVTGTYSYLNSDPYVLIGTLETPISREQKKYRE